MTTYRTCDQYALVFVVDRASGNHTKVLELMDKLMAIGKMTAVGTSDVFIDDRYSDRTAYHMIDV